MIPQGRVLVKIDMLKAVLSKSEIIIDMKNLAGFDNGEDNGVEILHTKYFLKKDCYAMIFNQAYTKCIVCNVNERVIIQSKNHSGESLLSPTLSEIEEASIGMFDITCSGASISKNKDLVAVGDFTGNVKVYCAKSEKTILIKEGAVPDQVRYIHFHDYHNDVLLIATFSGAVYVWNPRTQA